jgi:telomere length regulation protein
MDELFTPVSTTYFKPQSQPEPPLLTEVKSAAPATADHRLRTVSSVDDALEILKNQPDYDALISALKFLNEDKLAVPGPKSAGIVNLLVSEIAPNYWTLLFEGSSNAHDQTDDAELFLSCLRSVTGLNAIIAQIKVLIQEARSGGKEVKRTDVSLNLRTLTDLLASILNGHESIHKIWSSSTKTLPNASLKKAQSQKLASLLSNGQIISVSAEALSIMESDKLRPESQWIADGVAYSKWLGLSIAAWAKTLPLEEELGSCAELFQRSLSLNHSGRKLRKTPLLQGDC